MRLSIGYLEPLVYILNYGSVGYSYLSCCLLISGGLGFSTDQIGTALLSVAAPLLFLQVLLYPKVCNIM